MATPKLSIEDKIFKNLDGSDDWSIKGYQKRGGYDGLKKLLTTNPDAHIAQLKESALRGRGGAGI